MALIIDIAGRRGLGPTVLLTVNNASCRHPLSLVWRSELVRARSYSKCREE